MNLWISRDFKPMLLKETEKPFNSTDYIFEIKFDGIRALLFVSPSEFQIISRNGIDLTNIYPELSIIKKSVKKKTIIDGEIIAINKKGLPSFSLLQKRNHLKDENRIKKEIITNPVTFIAFDLLYEDKNLTNLSLLERKQRLNKLKENEYFVISKVFYEDGVKLFRQIKKLGLEGIIAKKKDSLYEINKRVDSWVKIKNLKEGTFYIGGYKDRGTYVISLLLGEYINDEFVFVGNVSISKKKGLYTKLIKSHIEKDSPFVNHKDKMAKYISNKYKCRIEYLERTQNNHLRQPIFKSELK